ncbi:MAG: sulfite exporter TauE/SafE family protein [Bacteroidales bacterium]
MFDTLIFEALTPTGIIVIILSIVSVGLAKAGIAGAGSLAIPVLAAVLGGKVSVGFLLPILLFADVIAVIYYKRTAQWKILFSILPWAIVGVGVATLVGASLSDEEFTIILSVIIITGVIITILRDVYNIGTQAPKHWLFSVVMGFLAGFTSMLGNAAGPIVTLFLLSLYLKKEAFAGTRAWYFFIMNIIKIPLHIFAWNTITLKSFTSGLTLFPIVIVGMIIGFWLIKIIPDKTYRFILLALTTLSAIILIFK